ncbi:MAG TPA: RidA family protein [Actinomycetota bacterium]|nr:RidA family protein [Actinomycetota bacterium]
MSDASGHRLVNPDTLPPPVGYAHAVVAAPGRVVALAGQAGHRSDGSLPDSGLVPQFEQAAANVAEALRAAGGRPEHLVQLLIFTTDIEGYRSSLRDVGAAYRTHFGKHYPAMALVGVTELFDAAAVVELVGLAVIPEA